MNETQRLVLWISLCCFKDTSSKRMNRYARLTEFPIYLLVRQAG